jgi:hypothetical protein
MADQVEAGLDEAGRPTATLPSWQLVRISLYWLGLCAVMGGITALLGNRLVAENFVPLSEQGDALFKMTALGAFIAMLVQPTTRSRAGAGASRTS